MKKAILFILTFYLITFKILNAQTLKFSTSEHDFGTIEEAKGNVSFKFTFTNTGNAPLIISKVTPSCGCTTPEFSKDPVLPGKSGFISVTYDPTNRPGAFNKSIMVNSNDKKKPTIELVISGEVNAKDKTVEDLYPVAMGNFRLENNVIPFATISSKDIKKESINVINTSTTNLKVEFENIPTYLSIKMIPDILTSNGKGRLEVTYDATKQNKRNFIIDNIPVKINGQNTAMNRLKISATIK